MIYVMKNNLHIELGEAIFIPLPKAYLNAALTKPIEYTLLCVIRTYTLLSLIY